ncbi:MAG TPA: hypothetical protein VFD58_28540 [Blastocatellia bacterium]|nr:hypothetical protein [Blastocatellia bacterium]
MKRFLVIIALIVAAGCSAGPAREASPASDNRSARVESDPGKANIEYVLKRLKDQHPWNDPRTSLTYAVLVVRRAEVEAELQDLKVINTARSLDADFARVRYELKSINREITRIESLPQSAMPGLTEHLGRMILGKISIETELSLAKYKRAELESLNREIELKPERQAFIPTGNPVSQ